MSSKVIGKLTVEVLEAKNLVDKDMGSGLSDPYVVVKLAGQKKKTKAVKDNLNPQWNEKFEFDVKDLQNETVEIEVFDEDIVGDETLGSLKLHLDLLAKTREKEDFTHLKNTAHGELHYRIKFAPLHVAAK